MNILIHATLYPEREDGKRQNTTMFLHYYAAEWVRAGHRVLVLHHKTAFPAWETRLFSALSRVPKLARVRDYLNGYGLDEDRDFSRDGVEIVRRSMTKAVPRTLYPRAAIRRRARRLLALLREREFAPDLVLCEFTNPGLYVALEMRDSVNAPVAAILHSTDMEYFARRLTARDSLLAASRADALLFRTQAAVRAFSERFFEPKKAVLMPSGVPKSLALPPERFVPRERALRYLCVCRHVPTKHAETVIEAFGRANLPGATLQLIGDGVERPALEALAKKQPNADAIAFLGVVPREDVFEALSRADCFALVSELETFGMAYVEAMSAGCVVIGSMGEGAEAFVRDGENGFLVPSGDAEALCALMKRLSKRSPDEMRALSRSAYETAGPLRDDLLAERILEELTK